MDSAPAAPTMNKNRTACDACKLRKIRCIPAQGNLACTHCRKQSIACTITRQIRKKTVRTKDGKRIKLARATFGEYQPGVLSESTEPDVSGTSLSFNDVDSRLSIAELSGSLAAHLLETYTEVPHHYLPMISHQWMLSLFEQVGRRLDCLPPDTEVLAYTIMAFTSTFSSHPLLFSPGSPPPSFDSIRTGLPHNVQLHIYGQRRASMCAHFRDRAISLSWKRGTLALGGHQNMTSCFLLEKLLERSDASGYTGKPYGSAFVTHVRELVTKKSDEIETLMKPMHWGYVLMFEALSSLQMGMTSSFVFTDTKLLCDPTPDKLEGLLGEARTMPRDFTDASVHFFLPYLYHIAAAARLCNDCMIGPSSRDQPLNEAFLSHFLVLLDDLHSFCTALDLYLESQVTTQAFPFGPNKNAISRHILKFSWASLALPPYLDLRRRITLLEIEENIIQITALQQKRDQYYHLLDHSRRVMLRGAKMISECIRDAPSILYVSHLMPSNLEVWAEVVLESLLIEDGEEYTRIEKVEMLKSLLDGIEWVQWSWPRDASNIEALRTVLQGWISYIAVARGDQDVNTDWVPRNTSQQGGLCF